MADQVKTVIFDCDPGVDDAIAMMAAASLRELLPLEGITTVAGNLPGDVTYRNARRLAGYLSLDVPVFKGADHPLFRTPVTAAYVHGDDGLGGMRAGDEFAPEEKRTAMEYLLKTIGKKRVSVVATGPLTNLAALFAFHPEVKENIDHLTIMGGSLSGGNITPFAEFNFYADPDAAAQVLSSGVPIRLVGLDVTHKSYLTDEEIEAFGNIQGRRAGMICDLMKQYGKYYKELGFPGTPVHDAAAMIYEAFGGQVFPGEKELRLEIVTIGDNMGECLKRDGDPNVSFVTEVDREAFVRVLRDCCTE